MTERPTWLVWLHLETTGSYEDEDRILEVGFVITDESFNVKSEHSDVVHEDAKAWRSQADSVVRDMHERKGLWDAISGPEALPLLDVEAEAISVLQSLANKHDFVLCGSGVSHFDRRFLKCVLRRSLELIGRTDAQLPKQTRRTEHSTMPATTSKRCDTSSQSSVLCRDYRAQIINRNSGSPPRQQSRSPTTSQTRRATAESGQASSQSLLARPGHSERKQGFGKQPDLVPCDG